MRAPRRLPTGSGPTRRPSGLRSRWKSTRWFQGSSALSAQGPYIYISDKRIRRTRP